MNALLLTFKTLRLMGDFVETELGNLPPEWVVKTVEELVQEKVLAKPLDGNHGNIHPKGTDFVNEGIPFIMASDINNGKVDLVNCKFISKKQADSLQKGFSKTGDVLLTHKASLGRTAIVQESPYPYIMLTPQVTYYRILNQNRLVNKYLKYYFDSPVFQNTLVNHGDSGSTRAYVGITAQRELPVIYPPIEIQSSISQTLGSLDDKIDLLHRQNETLEKMAETLFRQWFVEEADESWEEGVLGDYAEHSKVSVKPSGNPLLLFAHHSIPGFDNGKEPVYELGKEIRSNKYEVIENTILFSKLNPHKDKRVWLILENVPDNSICSTEFQVLKPMTTDNLYFIYGWLTNSINYREIASGVGGTSGSHQRISPNTIFSFPTPRVPDEILVNYAELVKPIFQRQQSNQTQIRSLTSLRDTLLPKLMSGEVRVNYA